MDGAVDLGGSVNLNLGVHEAGQRYVARVYRPSVSEARLRLLQQIRQALVAHVPVAVAVPTLHGSGWASVEDRLVEVEPFVDAPVPMRSLPHLDQGLQTLGRVHTVLRGLGADPLAAAAPFANGVDAAGLATAVARGTARIRQAVSTADAAAVAGLADQLAGDVEQHPAPTNRQLVHGDFWDDNVLFAAATSTTGPELVTDFDFATLRPRIDDLALTSFFVSQDVVDLVHRPDLLVRLVASYATHLDPPLTETESLALPAAMARQALWPIAVWAALLDDVEAVRALTTTVGRGLRWGRTAVERSPLLQEALTRARRTPRHEP